MARPAGGIHGSVPDNGDLQICAVQIRRWRYTATVHPRRIRAEGGGSAPFLAGSTPSLAGFVRETLPSPDLCGRPSTATVSSDVASALWRGSWLRQHRRPRGTPCSCDVVQGGRHRRVLVHGGP
uniref:Uncharacterized protein n=1 Tax=Arundo donax TaxID=35708 RepID=A0A0A9CE92_ARUDO